MNLPFSLASCLALSCTLSAALAQTSAAGFKSGTRASTPVAHPRISRTIDGSVLAGMQRNTGPRPQTGARLATLARPLPSSGTLGPVQMWRDAATGLPVFISAKPKPGSALLQRSTLSAEAAAFAFLGELRADLQVQRPEQEFRVTAVTHDNLGQTHVRLEQTWRGLPVHNAEVVVHLGADGQPKLFTGRHYQTPSALPDVTPAITGSAAADRASLALRSKTHVAQLSAEQQRLLDYTAPATQLVIYHPESYTSPVLTWHVTTRPSLLERWETFVDARTGTVLKQYESSCTANGPRTAQARDLSGTTRTVNTYEWNNRFYLIDGAQPMFNLGRSSMPDGPVGALLTLDANNTRSTNASFSHVGSTNNTWNNPSAISAHANAAQAYNYFRSTFGRNSLDGAGGTMISIVRLADDDGTGLDNAFWNGKFIAYGEGNVGFTPLAGSLDVAGHEMTHGVVEKSANLVYQGQSGALNESMADVFGSMMDRSDWLIGEDVVRRAYFPSGALRSMQDPHNGGTGLADAGFQPRHMNEFYNGSQDNGGVHINSGIPNWAFYKVASALGREHAEQIWYRALTTYLTRSSQFLDLRVGAIQSATDLYGAGSADVTAVTAAFDAVGIVGSVAAPPHSSLPVNPGQDYILSYDTNPTVTGTFYRSSTAGQGFQLVSNTAAISKPSVNDAGTAAVFVDAQHRLRAIQLTGSFNESVIQNQPIWHNAALSKDGTKLAAITNAQDTSIYVFNLASGQSVKYKLYNPTSAGTRGGGVLFADALEWDYSGEYLLYDAYNVIRNAQGQDIDFWDIGFLKVWDKNANTWGNGQIQKLVQNLPAGVSIGNPVLAKNSPNIMALDFFDATATAPFAVLAINLETGDEGTIFEGSNTAGTPNFSKLDDKLLFTALSTSGDTVVAMRALQPNKITPSGNPSVLIDDAKWGIWYSQGQRIITSTHPDAAPPIPGFSVYPNPTSDLLQVTTEAEAVATLCDMLGRPVLTVKLKSGARNSLDLSTMKAGTYLLKVTDKQRTSTRTVVKL
ncbi:M4 family metallopeptidase [Hymenobacter oligotrophus]|nr:M4 family metallopeptidase [Hymenobacter oligotrophus]